MFANQRHILASLLFLWAGLALGGNLIAAPAKFQVERLAVAQLLEVGRAQFRWLGFAEWGFLTLLLLGLVLFLRRSILIVTPAAILFLLQQLWMQPVLRARTDIIVAGGVPPDAHVHLVFIGLEAAKIVALVIAGFVLMKGQPNLSKETMELKA